MANEKISEALSDLFNKLPNSLNGNGQNFIFLLKKSLGTIADELNEKFEYISKIANAVTDTPDTTNEQIKNCKVQEVRVGTAISLILTWDYSDIKNYESCEIYIKEKKSDGNEVVNWDDVAVSREIRTTKTNTYTVDGINAGYTYQIRFQGKNNLGTVSEASGNPVLIYSVNALNNVPDPPTDFSVYFNRDGVLWTWRQNKNLDYIYSELRTDTNVGNTVGLLEVTQDTKSTKMPPVREGTAYLYNKGYGSKYSTPVTVNWSKPVPAAPQSITAISTYQGLQFSYSEIPEDCIGICISINGNKHYSQDDTFNFYCSTGSYTYKACYYDCFGEGTWSNEQTIGTVEEIPPDAVHITSQTVFDDGVIVGKYIGDHEVVGTKIKEGTITTENIAANAITSGLIATNAVTADKIEADAVTADKIATGAVTADSIGANAVTADKLTSGAVTADKLAANTINLAGALKIVGGNVTLDENGLEVKNTNGTSIVFNSGGMLSTDSTGQIFNVISRMVIGSGKNGQYVKFTKPWPNVPMVTVTPLSLITADSTRSNTVVRVHCYATNITNAGFNIVCYSSVDSTSYTFGVSGCSYSYSERVSRKAYTSAGVDTRGDNGLYEMRWSPAHTYNFSFGISPKAKTVDITISLFAQTHYSYGDTLDFRGTENNRVTLYANGATIWSGAFDTYVKGESSTSQTISTGKLNIPSTSTITGTFWSRPYFSHPGDDSENFDVQFNVLSASGTLDTGNATNYIDTEGEALFLAVDGGSSNFTVS